MSPLEGYRMKIKEIYLLQQEAAQEGYALDEWYNSLINKDISELNTVDLCRMIRQNILIELAIEKAIDVLKTNPLVGDVYDGQLLELLYSVDEEKIREYIEPLNEILLNIKQNLEIGDFICQEDYHEYLDLVEKFLTKINSL